MSSKQEMINRNTEELTVGQYIICWIFTRLMSSRSVAYRREEGCTMRVILPERTWKFADHLIQEEKSPATREKYLRDVRFCASFAGATETLCAAARVAKEKVFPYNLRNLFARSFCALNKDIAQLADILGHSSIDITQIYIMTTGTEHRRKIEKLGLVVWQQNSYSVANNAGIRKILACKLMRPNVFMIVLATLRIWYKQEF